MDVRLLQEQVAELEAQYAVLHAKVEHLERGNQALQEQLDDALRAAARQAAPFCRPKRKRITAAQKKRLGRKLGHPGGLSGRP